jgi:DtxR family transcriptional regulator, Mn-dependent transcriptional regulator
MAELMPARAMSRTIDRERYTTSVEDYLKAIYELCREGGENGSVGTNGLAQRLTVAPGSVSGMLRRLADQGLVAHEPYYGVRLTEEGRRIALKMIRRHRIIETYLVRSLGYSWDRVHDEAERMEHTASDELVDRMARALGDPPVDPHGAPIPTREGVVVERVLTSLADLPEGEHAQVVQVSDDDPSLLRYLDEVGLRLGTRVRMLAKAPFEGPLRLVVGSGKRAQERSVGPQLAGKIRVARQ